MTMTCKISSPSRPRSRVRACVLLALASLPPLACGAASDAGSDTDTTPTTSTPADSADESSTTAAIEPDQWDDLLEPVPGSRLRPRFRVADDGTRAQIGWYDTMFEMPCEFREVPDAGLRCVTSIYGDSPWLYADPDCSEPVIQDIWLSEGTGVVVGNDKGCIDKQYYEIGEPVTEIYFDANGPCEHFSNDPAHRVYVVPNDQFVGATVTPLEGNSRIVPLLLEADDGARQIFGAWDREHEEAVAALPDAADQLRWFGHWEPSVSPIYFADASCTERVALAGCLPDSEHPRTARETGPEPCRVLVGRYELVEELGRDVHRLRPDGGCEPYTFASDSYTRLWRVGAPLDDAAYAVASALEDGGVRLRHDVHASPEGEPFLSSVRFYDRLLAEVECSWRDQSYYQPGEPPTGTLDCVPSDGASLINRFLDSDCSEETAERWLWDTSCPSEAQHAYGHGAVATLAGPTAGAGGYMRDDADDCVPAPAGDGGDEGTGGEEEHYLVDPGSELEAAHAVDVVE